MDHSLLVRVLYVTQLFSCAANVKGARCSPILCLDLGKVGEIG